MFLLNFIKILTFEINQNDDSEFVIYLQPLNFLYFDDSGEPDEQALTNRSDFLY